MVLNFKSALSDSSFDNLHLKDLDATVEASDALSQAIKAMVNEAESSDYIDPSHALGPTHSESFGSSFRLASSQNSASHHHALTEDDLYEQRAAAEGLRLSSCDEDAEGELDESFSSEHSFWLVHPADTSVSTVATIDADEPLIPLLSRDGKWKGVDSRTLVTRVDADGDRSTEHDQSSHHFSHLQEEQTIPQTVLHHAVPAASRRKRAVSLSSSESGFDYTSNNRKPKRSKAGKSRTKSKSRKDPPEPRQANEAASASSKQLSGSRLYNNESPSSDVGSVSAASKASSSPSGSYKLRKKDKVPQRSLAALLTPPPKGDSDQSYFQPEDAPGEWVDDVKVEQPVGTKAISHGASVELERDTCVSRQDGAVVTTVADLDGLLESVHETKPIRDLGTRVFPAGWEMHDDFPLFYRRYHVPSSVSPEVLEMLLRGFNLARFDDDFHEIVDRAQSVHGAFNKPRSILDLYTPRFVRNVGAQKVGMCPVCYEEGKVKFLKTKFSAYNYHLQNFHGVSAITGLPFTPPMKFRTKSRPSAKPKERKTLIQGLCHTCAKWVDVQGPKETEVKVAEIYWWKHAQVCHRNCLIPKDGDGGEGLGGYFVEDQWFERVRSVLDLLGGMDVEIRKLLAGNR